MGHQIFDSFSLLAIFSLVLFIVKSTIGIGLRHCEHIFLRIWAHGKLYYQWENKVSESCWHTLHKKVIIAQKNFPFLFTIVKLQCLE